MEEMGRVCGIKVVAHSHNEPGHGSDQCDSCGANCVRACYAWHLKNGKSIDHAIQTVEAMEDSEGLKGMVHMLMEHDPLEKLNPSKIPNLPLGTRSCLHKRYCYSADTLSSTATLFQHRFFCIGGGYPSDAAFLKQARCGHTYKTKKVTATSNVAKKKKTTTVHTHTHSLLLSHTHAHTHTHTHTHKPTLAHLPSCASNQT